MSKELAESLEPSVTEEEIKQAESEAPVEAATEEKPAEAPKAEEVQPEKLVRLEALHEERTKRKELARQLESEKRERAAFEARMNERVSQLAQINAPQPQLPDPNDPLAVHQHQIQEQGRVLQQLAYARQQEAAQQQQYARTADLINWAKSEAQEFAKEQADFGEAYKHVAINRVNQLKAMGLSPDEVQNALARDELWVYEHARASGKNPGQIIYEMANNTGYKPKGTSGAEKIETLQKGVAASKSLNSGAPSNNPTAEQIANMSDAEFADLKAKLKKQGKRVSDIL
jgi:hypothetical protein